MTTSPVRRTESDKTISWNSGVFVMQSFPKLRKNRFYIKGT